MKLYRYLTDRRHTLGLGFAFYIIMVMFFVGFRVERSLIVAFTILFAGFFVVALVWDFLRKRKFYNTLVEQVELLDQKYLVLEMLSKPEFYEGEIIYQEMYEIHKSMVENVSSYRQSMDDFKDYIEMWIHEVKIPIASLVLMCHNHRAKLREDMLGDGAKQQGDASGNKVGLSAEDDWDIRKLYDQVRRLDGMIDQVLYYVRAEHAEKDYLIKEISLKELVKRVAIHNKEDLLENRVDFSVNVSGQVVTDGKWLEFILNQLVNNSMKYRRTDVQPEIHIYTEELTDCTKLVVWDNGVGIVPGDLPRVFDKSFTGENGRARAKSTGMGLYIAKKLCNQLGHGIEISSVSGEGTRVTITILKNNFYKMS